MSIFANKRKKRIGLAVSMILLLALSFSCAVYLSDYYHADTAAISSFSWEGEAEITTLEDKTMICNVENADAGLIFYPGGKVEHYAYLPLMKALADEGITSILVKMPFNLAVFEVDAAEGLQEYCPEITDWYIGGHSLGGSMAASYLGDHMDEYEGLILLGSYSTEDFSDTDLEVLSVYGSEDHVLNPEKYAEYKVNLPQDFEEVIIEGGCHAYFGMYGAQEGDGIPTISNEEQIKDTAEAIANFIE